MLFALKSAWTCPTCLAKSRNPKLMTKRYLQARPSRQRLSKDVAGKAAARPGKSATVFKPRIYRPDEARVSSVAKQAHPKRQDERMSKTGKSVLTPMPVHERTAEKIAIKNVETFENTRLMPLVLVAMRSGPLKDLEYAKPTAVQARAIPAILKAGKNDKLNSFLIAAETGSGKTLAYLAPVMQLLKKQEIEDMTLQRQVGRPRCIILLPSTELVTQVGAVVKSMSHAVKLSSKKLLPEYDFRKSKNQVLRSPVDILVTLPHRLTALMDEGIVNLSDTKHLIIDEADTLLDESFADLVRPIIAKSRGLDNLIFCSATIPRSVDAFLMNRYKDLERLVSAKIHSIPRRIATKFIDVGKDFNGDRRLATHQILRDLSLDASEPGKVKKIILFVNKRESVQEVADYIVSKGFEALPYSGNVMNRERNIASFLETAAEEKQQGETGIKVLVTTDLASRGIDTTTVKNVIIYDTPHSTIDLLHRIGRTGRAGRRGTAYILEGKRRGEDWLHEVKHLSISGQPLI